MPVLAPGLATDALYGGIQAGYEKALKGLVVAQSGADLITGGIGLLHGAGVFSLPQVVIDAEIAAMILRLLDGAEVSAATVMNAVDGAGRLRRRLPRQKETTRRLRAGEVFHARDRDAAVAWSAGRRRAATSWRRRASAPTSSSRPPTPAARCCRRRPSRRFGAIAAEAGAAARTGGD